MLRRRLIEGVRRCRGDPLKFVRFAFAWGSRELADYVTRGGCAGFLRARVSLTLGLGDRANAAIIINLDALPGERVRRGSLSPGQNLNRNPFLLDQLHARFAHENRSISAFGLCAN
jgi:hypothetical protein